ncbi:BUD31-like protein isoform X1 [Lasioglossum baleicum]|uniref:BUD31-like protein isoform X1 n=1 Tax=Lasioglossum baleicum TaxID=434251 RepID=UPI003FCE2486
METTTSRTVSGCSSASIPRNSRNNGEERVRTFDDRMEITNVIFPWRSTSSNCTQNPALAQTRLFRFTRGHGYTEKSRKITNDSLVERETEENIYIFHLVANRGCTRVPGTVPCDVLSTLIPLILVASYLLPVTRYRLPQGRLFSTESPTCTRFALKLETSTI